jgi:hypothetical protein
MQELSGDISSARTGRQLISAVEHSIASGGSINPDELGRTIERLHYQEESIDPDETRVIHDLLSTARESYPDDRRYHLAALTAKKLYEMLSFGEPHDLVENVLDSLEFGRGTQLQDPHYETPGHIQRMSGTIQVTGESVQFTSDTNAQSSFQFEIRSPEARLQSWHRYPDAQLDGKRSEEHPDAATVLSLLADPVAFNDRVHPLAIGRVDVSSAGIRGLSAEIEGCQGIFCFSGLGVVRPATTRYGGIDRESPAMILGAVENRPVTAVHETMGNLLVDEEGTFWTVKNKAPFGGYAPGEVADKCARTARYSNDDRFEIVLTGQIDDGPEEYFVYKLPEDVISPVELMALELQLDPAHHGTLYGAMVGGLFSQMRQQHNDGIVHLQRHSGNWHAHYRDGKPEPLVCDWATAVEVEHLPEAASFEANPLAKPDKNSNTFFSGLTSAQKSVALDFFNATSSITLASDLQARSRIPREIFNRFSIEIDSIGHYQTEDSVHYQIKNLAYALAGYCEPGASRKEIDETAESLLDVLRPLAEEAQEIYGNGLLSYEQIYKLDVNIAVTHALKELMMRFSREVAQHPDTNWFRRTRLDPSFLLEGPRSFIGVTAD